ncbi:MAG: alpha-N-arabinofuranosidase [Firmicutes bacterium]|nr:alpha-N-arabinofuranosidase [Bacillota bacterium]
MPDLDAKIIVNTEFDIGEVDPRLYGSFLEHVGRAIYGGIYDPHHPTADSHGYRTDVMDLVRELSVPLIRYPGGNFVSGYRWEDGIGPQNQRKVRLDLAWRAVEPNLFGLNEFVEWARMVQSEVMMVVNLGTRGIDEACSLLEYCNFPGGTYWSDLRIRHGYSSPHQIKVWCLGNEMDGPWQLGHKTADEYGRLAAETAHAMRQLDPSIELVVAGSSHSRMPTFPEWERVVLEHTYQVVDYISLHSYYGNANQDSRDFLASSVDMDQFINAVIAACDYVKAKMRASKTLYLSFDEWNVWFHSQQQDQTVAPWQVGPPLLEDIYTLEDALVVGTLLITLLRHADRVKMASLAQLVNVIAPIKADPGQPAWRQTIFYPFLHASKWGRGRVLQTLIRAPLYSTRQYGDVPTLDAICVDNESAGELVIFGVNRHLTETLTVEIKLENDQCYRGGEHVILYHDDLMATNSAADPNRVRPYATSINSVIRDALTLRWPPHSWNVIRLKTTTDDSR